MRPSCRPATAGAISVFATNDTDVILDINGYFVAATNPAGLAFYPVTPCRLVDTRRNLPQQRGNHWRGPAARCRFGRALVASPRRLRPIRSISWSCPRTGRVPDCVSDGRGAARRRDAERADGTRVTANAAIVPAGTAEASTCLPATRPTWSSTSTGISRSRQAGGLSLYNLPPCRALDTRLPWARRLSAGRRM